MPLPYISKILISDLYLFTPHPHTPTNTHSQTFTHSHQLNFEEADLFCIYEAYLRVLRNISLERV